LLVGVIKTHAFGVRSIVNRQTIFYLSTDINKINTLDMETNGKDQQREAERI
jgi:hypothetical protein